MHRPTAAKLAAIRTHNLPVIRAPLGDVDALVVGAAGCEPVSHGAPGVAAVARSLPLAYPEDRSVR
jgi:hypothetical protein